VDVLGQPLLAGEALARLPTTWFCVKMGSAASPPKQQSGLPAGWGLAVPVKQQRAAAFAVPLALFVSVLSAVPPGFGLPER
jgi:hypothetical protein